MKNSLIMLFVASALSLFSQEKPASSKPRARDLGVPFKGQPGQWNAITDVPGVEVGFKTLIEGEGKLQVGKGPVRTGVTVVLPKGKNSADSYAAAWFSLNGDGEMTGLPYVEDYGTGYGPVGITNTNSVGIVRDAIGEWCYKRFSSGDMFDFSFGLPVVGETWDGSLNDINGYHVRKEHVFEALDASKTGPVAEGNVGGGTGMWLYGFKGGTGTASRVFKIGEQEYVLGVLAQCNFGKREQLTVAGVPVGEEIKDFMPVINEPVRSDGSVIVVVGTNAPLLPGQLKQVAKRVSMGLARTGSTANESSGDIFFAFSTTGRAFDNKSDLEQWSVLPKWELNPVYQATVEATEEAVINALVAAETMVGMNENKLYGIPHDRLKQVLEKYNRLIQK